MFRCSIAAANTDNLQFKFKFTFMSCGIHCVDDKNDNEEGRAPLEYLPRGLRFSSYATVPHSPFPHHLSVFPSPFSPLVPFLPFRFFL